MKVRKLSDGAASGLKIGFVIARQSRVVADEREKSGIDAVPWLRSCVNADKENRLAAAVVAMMNVRILDFSRQAPGRARQGSANFMERVVMLT